MVIGLLFYIFMFSGKPFTLRIVFLVTKVLFFPLTTYSIAFPGEDKFINEETRYIAFIRFLIFKMMNRLNSRN